MSELVLFHGNKNYSSWSMRAWLALKATGEPFEEVAFDLQAAGVRDQMRELWPSGRVPALRHGDRMLWDSLSIAEYLAERFPDRGLWPRDNGARALARTVVAEMHSQFPDLRNEMPLNVRRSSPGKGRTDRSERDIRRVTELWTDCRERFGAGGAFLFRDWCLADVFYAPVVSRFRTYAVELDATCQAYADAVWNRADVQEWAAAAAGETSTAPHYDL